jgi:hypothetical protein
MKIRLILAFMLLPLLFACGNDKPPMVPDQEPAAADGGAD